MRIESSEANNNDWCVPESIKICRRATFSFHRTRSVFSTPQINADSHVSYCEAIGCKLDRFSFPKALAASRTQNISQTPSIPSYEEAMITRFQKKKNKNVM